MIYIFVYRGGFMRINNIQSPNYGNKASHTKENPNFRAMLCLDSNIERYVAKKVGNSKQFNKNISVLSKRLAYIEPISEKVFVTLTKEAKTDINKGIPPKEPVAEVFLGYLLGEELVSKFSESVKINITDKVQELPEKVCTIATDLIKSRYQR